ncbi:hypothetical protein FXO37_16347 [Capsicum annuum]|nr:hypothetical protein FXO37_16347 [Capsicum annuum]
MYKSDGDYGGSHLSYEGQAISPRSAVVALLINFGGVDTDISKFQPHNNLVNQKTEEKKRMIAHLIDELMLGARALTLQNTPNFYAPLPPPRNSSSVVLYIGVLIAWCDDCLDLPYWCDGLHDVETIKEIFAKLLLGEDVTGGSKGVSTALALSNAITNLAESTFTEEIFRSLNLTSENNALESVPVMTIKILEIQWWLFLALTFDFHHRRFHFVSIYVCQWYQHFTIFVLLCQ